MRLTKLNYRFWSVLWREKRSQSTIVRHARRVRYPEISIRGKTGMLACRQHVRPALPHSALRVKPVLLSMAVPAPFCDPGRGTGKLADIFAIITPSLPHSITLTIGDALMLAYAKANPILITGSLHFAGEVLVDLRGEPAAFEECAQ